MFFPRHCDSHDTALLTTPPVRQFQDNYILLFFRVTRMYLTLSSSKCETLELQSTLDVKIVFGDVVDSTDVRPLPVLILSWGFFTESSQAWDFKDFVAFQFGDAPGANSSVGDLTWGIIHVSRISKVSLNFLFLALRAESSRRVKLRSFFKLLVAFQSHSQFQIWRRSSRA